MVDVIECAFVPRAIVPLFKEEDKINLLPAFKSKSVVFISRLPPVFLKYSVLLCLKLKTPLPLMNIPSPSIAALEPSARTPPASVCTSNVLVFIFRFSAFNSNPAEFVNLRYSFESFCKLNLERDDKKLGWFYFSYYKCRSLFGDRVVSILCVYLE